MRTTKQLPAARGLAGSERGDVARVLSSAFADDPVFAWCIPDQAARHALLPEFFSARIMSPLEMCGIRNVSTRRAACVPLPAPGGPTRIMRMGGIQACAPRFCNAACGCVILP